MARIYFRVEMPEALLAEFMQSIRDFDLKHDPHHEDKVRFESVAETDWPQQKLVEMFRALKPSPSFLGVKKFGSESIVCPHCGAQRDEATGLWEREDERVG